MPKLPIFYILYRNEDLDYIKSLDPNVAAIEDVMKLNPQTMDQVIEYLLGQIPNNHVILKYLLVELENAGYDNVGAMFSLYINTMIKYLKSSDPNFYEKIKFLLKDGPEEYRAIGILNVPSVPKPRAPVKKPVVGKGKVQKIEFDLDFYDKACNIPCVVDTNKMLVYNPHFERMLRHNIIEACNLISKIDPDKDLIKSEFETYVEQFNKGFLNKLALSFNNLNIFEFDVAFP